MEKFATKSTNLSLQIILAIDKMCTFSLQCHSHKNKPNEDKMKKWHIMCKITEPKDVEPNFGWNNKKQK